VDPLKRFLLGCVGRPITEAVGDGNVEMTIHREPVVGNGFVAGTSTADMASRVTIATLGLVGSLALSAVLWVAVGTPVFFLFVPFVPFVLRGGRRGGRRPTYRCSRCGFRTRDSSYEYCPRDGTRLSEE
jgi:hypothetical protein